MKAKLNISPVEVFAGYEMYSVDSVFGVLDIRRYFKQHEWVVFAPFWWEHLFNKNFNTIEEAINFIEMRCEEYINEVLEWVVPHNSLQEK